MSSWNHPFIVQPDDVFLLCSDGLYDLVSDRHPHGDDPWIATRAGGLRPSMRRAERGRSDNISAVIVHLRAADRPAATPGITRTIGIVS